jgi:metal-responsive CopG/Arc/MetJ family transcriptional regulator
MARPKKAECLERVQIYLPKELLKKLELTDFIKKENFSKKLRDFIDTKINKDSSNETE